MKSASKVLTREQELVKLLKEAAEFLKARGAYYYGDERRGPAAKLLERIEDAVVRFRDGFR